MATSQKSDFTPWRGCAVAAAGAIFWLQDKCMNNVNGNVNMNNVTGLLWLYGENVHKCMKKKRWSLCRLETTLYPEEIKTCSDVNTYIPKMTTFIWKKNILYKFILIDSIFFHVWSFSTHILVVNLQ